MKRRRPRSAAYRLAVQACSLLASTIFTEYRLRTPRQRAALKRVMRNANTVLR